MEKSFNRKMNPLHLIFGIENIIKSLNKKVVELGWHRATKDLMSSLGLKVEANINGFPSKGTVLVYANHPTGIDPYLVSSVLGRDDVYFLSDIYQTLKGNNVSKHILPVYYWNLMEFVYKPLLSWPGFFIMRVSGGTVSREFAYRENQRTIRRAVNLLKKGRVVIIFPSGGEITLRPWKSGIGKIIKQCYQKNINFILYQVNISNLSEQQLLIHFLLGRRYYQKQPIKMLGKIRKINSRLLKINSYQIAQYLKRSL